MSARGVNPDAPRGVDAIVFDKDGTLFDFHHTWSGWARDLIETLAREHGAALADLADAVGFDLEQGALRLDSPAVAATNRDVALSLARVLPRADAAEIERHMTYSTAGLPLVPAVPLDPFLTGLAARGLVLGVMTNDSAYSAAAHLESAGIKDHFAFVAGADSGHGAKPEPGPLLAFARLTGVDPGRVVMVGDSTHDLLAGRAAGMQTLGVLTGVALHDDLAPHADAILPDIGHIPAWLDG